MTIDQLILYIAIFSIILTAIEYKIVKNYFYSFLQNFVGAFFIVSGAVKVIDPLGTAFKMEEYFAEFHTTFIDTWVSFIAPVFPFLSQYSVSFSMIMIVFELLLGVALLIGFKPKLTGWLYLILVIFFTFLTGFTYLTGYVPRTANFFDFGMWQAYDASNMRVTDCGCFGDFIVLSPGVSFLKDLFLLIPGILFIFFSEKAHKLFSKKMRWIVMGIALVAFTYYGLSNYMWSLPDYDFRPFKEGVDVQAQMKKEAQALANVEITAFKVKNLETGGISTVPYDKYLADYKAIYGTEKYKTIEQVKSEPVIAPTEISDFSFFDNEGNNVVKQFLAYPGYTFMLTTYKFQGDVEYQEVEIMDTTYIVDTVMVVDENAPQDTTYKIISSVDTIVSRLVEMPEVQLYKEYEKAFAERLNPIMNKAKADGYKSIGLLAGVSFDVMEDVKKETGGKYDVYAADGVVLKTINRSNPGLILWHDGTVVQKWHYKQVPSYAQLKEKFITEE